MGYYIYDIYKNGNAIAKRKDGYDCSKITGVKKEKLQKEAKGKSKQSSPYTFVCVGKLPGKIPKKKTPEQIKQELEYEKKKEHMKSIGYEYVGDKHQYCKNCVHWRIFDTYYACLYILDKNNSRKAVKGFCNCKERRRKIK